jgi:hypothetical protein
VVLTAQERNWVEESTFLLSGPETQRVPVFSDTTNFGVLCN